MPSGWVIALCHLQWHLAHVHLTTHLARIISCTYCMKQHYTTTSLGIHYSYILKKLYECNIAMVMQLVRFPSTALWDLR
jgi:hypothetical protein